MRLVSQKELIYPLSTDEKRTERQTNRQTFIFLMERMFLGAMAVPATFPLTGTAWEPAAVFPFTAGAGLMLDPAVPIPPLAGGEEPPATTLALPGGVPVFTGVATSTQDVPGLCLGTAGFVSAARLATPPFFLVAPGLTAGAAAGVRAVAPRFLTVGSLRETRLAAGLEPAGLVMDARREARGDGRGEAALRLTAALFVLGLAPPAILSLADLGNGFGLMPLADVDVLVTDDFGLAAAVGCILAGLTPAERGGTFLGTFAVLSRVSIWLSVNATTTTIQLAASTVR